MIAVLAGAGIGLLAGVLAGLFGIGGGAVMIPLLGLVLGISQRQAQGVTLAVLLFPLGLPALWTYLARGVVLRRSLVACLVISFIPGVWLGARTAQIVPDAALRMAFALFLSVVALRLWKGPEAMRAGPSPASSDSRKALAIGLLGGVVSGLLGIGGGLVMIPLLIGWIRLNQLEAQATSLAVMLLPIGLPGVWVYARSGEGLPWLLILGLAAGFGGGSVLGARVAMGLRPAKLRRAFAIFLLVAAASLLLRVR